ncbi:MAG: STAS domain-containing protein [Chitinivibrionales bacterium]
MKIQKEIKKMVAAGYVLDLSGRWVPLKQAVASARGVVYHVSNKEVSDGRQWVPIDTYKNRMQQAREEQKRKNMHVELSEQRMWFKTRELQEKVLEVSLGGVIDQRNVSVLKQGLNRCIENGWLVLLVNFSELRQISSAGWGVMSAILPGLRKRGGELLVYAMNPSVTEEFVGMQFDKVFTRCEKKTDALRFSRQISDRVSNGMEIDPDSLTKEELLKRLVAQTPHFTNRKLRKKMHEIERGAEKMGFFAFLRMLRELDLETKEKRERFSRSW